MFRLLLSSRMKFSVVSIVIALISFTFGLVIAFWLSKYRIHSVPVPNATVEKVAGDYALIVSFPEHPPWAHSSFYDVAFDYKAGSIDISEMAVLWNPFSQNIYGRPPIVIKHGLLPQTYKVRYWDGEQFVPFGTLLVGDENKLVWHETDSGKGRP